MRLRETNGCFSKAIAMPMEPYSSKEIKQAWKQPQILSLPHQAAYFWRFCDIQMLIQPDA